MNNAQRFCPNSNMIELENLFRNYNNYVFFTILLQCLTSIYINIKLRI